MTRSRALLAVLALALVAPPAADAAPRTWLPGTFGDDGNPCTRTAPCLTLAHVLTVTDAGGEVNALDRDDYGVATISQAVTIDLYGGTASDGAAQTALTVNAAEVDRHGRAAKLGMGAGAGVGVRKAAESWNVAGQFKDPAVVDLVDHCVLWRPRAKNAAEPAIARSVWTNI